MIATQAVIFSLLLIDSCTSSSDENLDEENSKKEQKVNRFHWKVQHNADLYNIYRSTNPEEPFHLDRIKAKWDSKYPNSGLTEGALYHRSRRLLHELGRMPASRYREKPEWTKESDRDLVDSYYATFPGEKYHMERLNKEWKRRHPDFSKGSNRRLIKRAKQLIRRFPEYKLEDPLKTDPGWTDQHDSDLVHILHNTLTEDVGQSENIHKIWSNLHPNQANVTPQQLMLRARELQKKPPYKGFPWTEDLNNDLLRISRETASEKQNQGQKIHELWTHLHPGYEFMTPLYLINHWGDLVKKFPNKVEEEQKQSKRSEWTEENKLELIDLYRSTVLRNAPKQEFHDEWAQRHPKLALIPTNYLEKYAKRWAKNFDISLKMKKEEGTEVENISDEKKPSKYTPELDAEILKIYDSTYPKNKGHSTRMYKKWLESHSKDFTDAYSLWRHASYLKKRQSKNSEKGENSNFSSSQNPKRKTRKLMKVTEDFHKN